jgi:hypothetical protein
MLIIITIKIKPIKLLIRSLKLKDINFNKSRFSYFMNFHKIK